MSRITTQNTLKVLFVSITKVSVAKIVASTVSANCKKTNPFTAGAGLRITLTKRFADLLPSLAFSSIKVSEVESIAVRIIAATPAKKSVITTGTIEYRFISW